VFGFLKKKWYISKDKKMKNLKAKSGIFAGTKTCILNFIFLIDHQMCLNNVMFDGPISHYVAIGSLSSFSPDFDESQYIQFYAVVFN
jgi:hypothetical protein